MKRTAAVILLLMLILSGCRSTPFGPQSVIDWVDFIHWDGIKYDGIYSGVLANEEFVGEKIGEVKFKVADNVTNSNYKTKNGDAAFHEKGTEIYALKGDSDYIMVKDSREINGYRVYFARESSEYKWHFKDMPLDRVREIEIYETYTPDGPKKMSQFSESDKIQHFLKILTNSEESSNFQPDTTNGDPTYYDMVFYTDSPVAYKFHMGFDGKTYFWSPWSTNILSSEISNFLN
jgi:hypothetical protein